MRVKKGFELRKVCNENIIISHGIENIDFSKVISLNESAAYLWHKISEKEFDEKEMVDALLEEYDVDEATAAADVASLVNMWIEAGLVEK